MTLTTIEALVRQAKALIDGIEAEKNAGPCDAAYDRLDEAHDHAEEIHKALASACFLQEQEAPRNGAKGTQKEAKV